MPIRFSAQDVFQMAEKIEANGAAFYRRAAELQPGSGGLLNKLAGMEDVHKAIFADMRSKLSAAEKEPTAYDPNDEALLYLGTMADFHGGEGSPDAAAALTGKETMEEILKIAIGLEKKSILFYLGMKDMVPAKLGLDKIDHIIAEEKKHVVTLSQELNTVRKGM